MRSAFYNLINFINTAKVDDVYANAAKKILENINKIPELNITDVAEMCFVSTATISRLCRKLNYESFSDFKMDVTMNLRYFNHDSMRMQFDHQLPVLPVAGKTTKDLFNDHFENIVQNLRSTYEMIEFEELEKLVDLIYQSNEICFVENTYIDVLREFYKTETPGIVRNLQGEIVGKHNGYMNFTVGKRRGFDVFGAHEPHYVVKIDAKKNEIVVGSKADLDKNEFETQNFNAFLNIDEILKMDEIYVKIRYRSAKIACKIEISLNDNLNNESLTDKNLNFENSGFLNNQDLKAKIILKTPANGVASGQLAVFYDKSDHVIASGFIA